MSGTNLGSALTPIELKNLSKEHLEKLSENIKLQLNHPLIAEDSMHNLGVEYRNHILDGDPEAIDWKLEVEGFEKGVFLTLWYEFIFFDAEQENQFFREVLTSLLEALATL